MADRQDAGDAEDQVPLRHDGRPQDEQGDLPQNVAAQPQRGQKAQDADKEKKDQKIAGFHRTHGSVPLQFLAPEETGRPVDQHKHHDEKRHGKPPFHTERVLHGGFQTGERE